MKVEKSDDCRSKPLETEDGMTSTAQVRERLQIEETQIVHLLQQAQVEKKDVEGARGRSLLTPPPFSMK